MFGHIGFLCHLAILVAEFIDTWRASIVGAADAASNNARAEQRNDDILEERLVKLCCLLP
jgi:hypothetical protein